MIRWLINNFFVPASSFRQDWPDEIRIFGIALQNQNSIQGNGN